MEEFGPLLALLLRFHAGWQPDDVGRVLGAVDADVAPQQHQAAYAVDLPPFTSVTADFRGPGFGLYAVRLKAVWRCDFEQLGERVAAVQALLRGLELFEAGHHPFSLEASRARIEGKGTARFSSAVMFTGENRPEGKLIGKLHGGKSPEGAQIYAVELTWLPAARPSGGAAPSPAR
jgi:hypothetical protein